MIIDTEDKAYRYRKYFIQDLDEKLINNKDNPPCLNQNVVWKRVCTWSNIKYWHCEIFI